MKKLLFLFSILFISACQSDDDETLLNPDFGMTCTEYHQLSKEEKKKKLKEWRKWRKDQQSRKKSEKSKSDEDDEDDEDDDHDDHDDHDDDEEDDDHDDHDDDYNEDDDHDDDNVINPCPDMFLGGTQGGTQGGMFTLPDMNIPIPDQSIPMPDQSIPMPDQSIPMPDQAIPMPDQAIPMPDQAIPMPDQAIPMPDQSIPMPDQSIPIPDQSIPMPDQDIPNPDQAIPPINCLNEQGLYQNPLCPNLKKVAVGANFQCLLTETNEAFPIAKVYCWGNNQYGQLGDQTQFTRNSPNLNFPVDFTNIGNPINIELGDEFACAQIEVPNQTQTMIACWGRNQENQAGAQDVPVVTHPHMILKQDQQPLMATTLKLGAKHACAIDQNTPNTAYCWGNNQKGQLGLGNLQNQAFAQAINTQTLAIDQVHEIALGDAHTCLLTSSADRQKSIRCVGETSKIQPYPSLDQVGASCIQEINGSQRATCLNLPTLTIDMPLGVEPFGQLQSGGEHLSFMGVVDMTPMYFVFGQNQYGQLGFFEIANYLAYTFIPTLIYPTYGLYLIDQVILAGNQSYLLMQNDVLYSAGANDQGQLLIQSLVSQRLFRPTVFEHIYQFEAGKYSACALIEEAGELVLKCGGGCHGAYLGIGICQPCVDADYTLKPVIWQRDF